MATRKLYDGPVTSPPIESAGLWGAGGDVDVVLHDQDAQVIVGTAPVGSLHEYDEARNAVRFGEWVFPLGRRTVNVAGMWLPRVSNPVGAAKPGKASIVQYRALLVVTDADQLRTEVPFGQARQLGRLWTVTAADGRVVGTLEAESGCVPCAAAARRRLAHR